MSLPDHLLWKFPNREPAITYSSAARVFGRPGLIYQLPQKAYEEAEVFILTNLSTHFHLLSRLIMRKANSTTQYIFTTWHLIKERNTFTFLYNGTETRFFFLQMFHTHISCTRPQSYISLANESVIKWNKHSLYWLIQWYLG